MTVAIIDYEMGNLFSVRQACTHVGLEAVITQDADVVRAADGVILPGVGAFRDAMQTLNRLGMVDALRDVVAKETPLLGICLGMQLMMTESEEFGVHQGLDVIPGRVVRLSPNAGIRAKVPHVGWNSLHFPSSVNRAGTLLANLPDESRMYFVHSYYVVPDASAHVVTTTDYAGVRFCSSLQHGAICATQFHPERSGRLGLTVYDHWKTRIEANRRERDR